MLKCSWCPARFDKSSAWTQHRKTKHFHGTFRCPDHPSFVGKFAPELVAHAQQEYHDREGARFNCPKCNLRFQGGNSIDSDCFSGHFQANFWAICLP